MHRRILINLLKYALGIGLLAVVVSMRWTEITNALTRPFHYGPFIFALLVCLVSVLLTFVRWYVLVRAQDLPFTLPDAMRLGLIGYFFNTFLPGSIGGDIVKAAFLIREQSRRAVAVSTVLLDRAIGMCGLFWLVAGIGGYLWLTNDLSAMAERDPVVKSIVPLAWLGTLGSIVFWLVLGVLSPDRSERLAAQIERVPKLGHVLAEFWRAVRLYRNRGGSVALAMLLSITGHVGFVLVFYGSASTLTGANEIPSFASHFLFVPIGELVQAGFPTPGGIGGSEAVYGLLYSAFGARDYLGVLGSLIQRCIGWILGLLGFLVYLQMRPAIKRRTAVNVETGSAAAAADAV